MRRVLFLVMTAGCSEPADDGIDALGPDAGLLRPDAAPPRPTSTTLVVTIVEGAGGPPIPGRIVLYGEDGKHLGIGKLDMWNGVAQDRGFCDLGPGVIGTWDGIALPDGTGEIPVGDDRCDPSPAVPFGRYRLVALQGIEHEMFETEIVLGPKMGKVQVVAPLRRAWTPDSALSADLHVHANGSGDSLLPRDVRVLSELSAGIKVIGSSDHNSNGTFTDVIEALGLRGKIASLPGNEVTTDFIHANVFPALIEAGAPRGGAAAGEELLRLSAAQLWARLRTLPGGPLVQLNHPRLRYAAYYDYAGWNGVSWPPPMPIGFDAVEVLNGMSAFNLPGDERIMRSAEDLYTLYDHGHLVTGMANSDTHHLTDVLAGVPRNYVFADDLGLDPFDEDGFVDALRQRRVLMTTGPWLDVHVGGARTGGQAAATGGRVHVELVLLQASYVKATQIRVWLGRSLQQTLAIPSGATRFDWSGDLELGGRDGWIAVDALGSEGLPRELHGLAGGKPAMPPFAMINPILIDGDGDGRYTPRAEKPWLARDLLPPPWDGKRPPRECGPLPIIEEIP